ncbi:Uncharacterized protein P5673_026010 [Acropora cervicornis]|uniref:Integrase catalytic domain-containing protein n=1 Tax=Acropora cervicornis TaxID=6130 RepID=A0AAD9UWT2_ACRCE|nr:Uncharacterized protein P5673_026010 [Acropora cervicornis]
MCPAGFDIHGFIKPSTAILRTYGGGEIRPVGLVQLVCETQGKFHTLQFQLLNKDVMGSQPPLLNGSDCVRLGLIEIGRRTCSLDRNKPNGGASEVCQPDLGPHRGRVKESYTPGEEVRPAPLKGSATEELNLTEETTSTSPIHGSGEDISVVHSSVTREGQVNPKGSMANEVELQTIELNSPNMYPNTLEEIKAETEVDPSLSVLCAFVAHGWSSDKSQVPTALRHYYPLRDEPAVYHGVLYKSHKVLIPLQLQSTLLKKLHQGHQGGESMIRRALEVMYWPGMQAAILQEIDHYSDWFEVDLLNEDITAANVISVIKAHFARYGIPDPFLSDNGPQYTSQEYLNFAKTYGFKLITRSPYYARATGKAEAAVMEAKKMLKKSDLVTGLLDHRNTPPQGMTYSPAQRILCRRTKSNLPISESLLTQSVPPVTVVRDEHLGRRTKAKAHYDKTASRDLCPLAPGQFVYTRPNNHNRGDQWRHGEVLGKNNTENRGDVGKSAETIVPNSNSESPHENSLPPAQTSRYGRPIRPPKRLDL